MREAKALANRPSKGGARRVVDLMAELRDSLARVQSGGAPIGRPTNCPHCGAQMPKGGA